MGEILNTSATPGQQDNGSVVIAENSISWFTAAQQNVDWTEKSIAISNSLRVYQDGNLTFGVYPGRFVISTGTIIYNGSTSNSIATFSTKKIWLDNAGTLNLGNSYPGVGEIITLASITTIAVITNITDERQVFTSVASGYSGYSGTSGATGTSGYSGYSGTSGATGTSGYSGKSGTSGATGTSGYSGYSGTSGATGTSGYSGYSGAGTSGYSG